MADREDLLVTARWVLAMLERLSADSIYAHRASGLRGSILRQIDAGESIDTLQVLVETGFEILEKAAAELRGLDTKN